YENIDIDLSKSYLNYDLVNDTKFDFNKKIDEKIEKNYKGKRKIRTDAIKHIDGLITSDNVFLINYLKKRQNSFLSMLKRSWKKNTVKKIFYMRQYIWMR
ncbi:recombinase, partial [Staphylococcus epidermidis]